MSAVFAEWQPRYAEHNVATFPVTASKVPAVKGYLKVGLNASEQLAMKFPDNDAFGLACRRNRITVLDVDTPDERVLADGLARHGPTPFIVRSGSGNFQAWYRHNGEKRRVRPEPDKPIDILGDGFVVCPPSKGSKGQYQIIQGSLDDLDRLPKMRAGVSEMSPSGDKSTPTDGPHGYQLAEADVSHGRQIALAEMSTDVDRSPGGNVHHGGQIAPRDIKRNDTLWRHCMKIARSCARLENLMEAAVEYNNSEFYRPLPADEVLKIVASAWGYEVEGKNRFGYGPRLVVDVEVVDDLLRSDLRAFGLFAWLMRHHAGVDEFILAKGTAESLGWSVNTMRAARDALVAHGLIECTHEGGKKPNDPPLYRFKKGVRN